MNYDFIGNTGLPADLLTTDNRGIRRFRVDIGQTGFFEGREFRIVRKITTPITYKFVAPCEFILSFQGFSIVSGEFEFYAWREDGNVTEATPFNTVTPIFAKNTSLTRPLYGDDFYQRQINVFEGGTINIVDTNLYADYEQLKAATASGQTESVEGSGREERYLAAGTYFLQFTGTGVGSYRITWEERPMPA